MKSRQQRSQQTGLPAIAPTSGEGAAQLHQDEAKGPQVNSCTIAAVALQLLRGAVGGGAHTCRCEPGVGDSRSNTALGCQALLSPPFDSLAAAR